MQEILKQPQYEPMSLADQVMVIYAGTQGYADQVPLERVHAWEISLLRYMESSNPEIGKDIIEKKRITEETEAKLRSALDTFTNAWQ
jgi:F-type H+-transporting ATPase subunit alpha